MKKVIKLIAIVLVVVLLIFITIIIVNTVFDYRPSARESLTVRPGTKDVVPDSSVFSFLTWNIGYCGLGREMDFFYEGGKHSRPPKDIYKKYLQGVAQQLSAYKGLDFILLQETDAGSRRSFWSDQYKLFGDVMSEYYGVYAVNYDVRFVPFPVINPMGRVKSGLMLLSKCKPVFSERYSLPGSYSWPKSVFFLDRCFILSRFKIPGAGELVVINLHNSAFDDAASIREKEMACLKNIMESEYAKGNYVVAGGDWNLNPFGYDSSLVQVGYMVKNVIPKQENHVFRYGWKWVYDSSSPTNRDVNRDYQHGITKTTILDFFVISPNIDVIDVQTMITGFEFSDHQPVFMKIKIKRPENQKSQ